MGTLMKIGWQSDSEIVGEIRRAAGLRAFSSEAFAGSGLERAGAIEWLVAFRKESVHRMSDPMGWLD